MTVSPITALNLIDSALLTIERNFENENLGLITIKKNNHPKMPPNSLHFGFVKTGGLNEEKQLTKS